jgi:hypothetical protein
MGAAETRLQVAGSGTDKLRCSRQGGMNKALIWFLSRRTFLSGTRTSTEGVRKNV